MIDLHTRIDFMTVPAYRDIYAEMALICRLGYNPQRLLTDQSDRTKLEKVAGYYRDYAVLITAQRETSAKLIRACTAKLASNRMSDRTEVISALTELANMLHKEPK